MKVEHAPGLIVDWTDNELKKMVEIMARQKSRRPIREDVIYANSIRDYITLSKIFKEQDIKASKRLQRKERNREIGKLFLEGKTIIEIGRIMNMPRMTVDYIIKKC